MDSEMLCILSLIWSLCIKCLLLKSLAKILEFSLSKRNSISLNLRMKISRRVQPPLHWVPGLAKSLAPRKHLVPMLSFKKKNLFIPRVHHHRCRLNYSVLRTYVHTGLETGDVMQPMYVCYRCAFIRMYLQPITAQ